MDQNGRLIIDKNGKETFVGGTFEETGLVEGGPDERRRRAALIKEFKLAEASLLDTLK